MYYCEVKVGFDDQTASVTEREKYFRVIDKYNALGIGNSKTGKSTLHISTAKKSDVEQLVIDLSACKILSIQIG